MNEEKYVTIWKSDSFLVNKKDKMLGILILHYLTTKNQYGKDSFYRCSFKVDSIDNWKSEIERILKLGPGENSEFGDLFEDEESKEHSKVNFRYSKKIMNRSSLCQFLRVKIKKGLKKSAKEFEKKEYDKKAKIRIRLPRKFDPTKEGLVFLDVIENAEDFEKGKWYHTFIPKKVRTKESYRPKVIY